MKTTTGISPAAIGELRAAHDTGALPELAPRHITPAILHPALEKLAAGSGGVIRLERGGSSYGGEPIFTVTAGNGPTRVLLWSQMHGDESTATRALGDLFSHIARTAGAGATRDLLTKLTITAVPMLNPDGAKTCTRRTAQGIDMNRDALALRTPEGRLLSGLAGRIRPDFCFNLHDQELSTVGDTTEITALALLAPAFDPGRGYNTARSRARGLAALMAGIATSMLPGKVATYDDAHEPRAFGDTFQREGYATVLVESGHIRGDGKKDEVRKVNFVLLLASLQAIARGGTGDVATDEYGRLPVNGKRAYDVIIRNVTVGSGMASYQTDLGISRQVDTHPEDPPRLVDAGDLRCFAALEELDGSKTVLRPEDLALNAPFDYLRFTRR
jgi:hypothetical protein